jgi:hypothetical protein
MAKSSNPASHLTTPSFSTGSSAFNAASVNSGTLGSPVGTLNGAATGFTPSFGVADPSLTPSGLSGTGLLASSASTSASSGATVSTSSAVSGSGEGNLAGSAPSPRNLTLSPIDINSSLGIQLGSNANLFEVSFNGFPISLRRTSSSFVTNSAGLLCHDASLPGTSFGTADIFGVYQQVTQKYAHSRIYPTISLTFYEDRSYQMITFFEDWQNHMTVTGTSSVNSSNYFYRMRYPSDYKCDTMFITKFEKDYGINGYGPLLQYQFLKVFPLNLSAVPISYGDSDIMKVTVEFSYDRYLMKNNGLGADDGIRPSQTGQNMITGSTTSSAAAASAPTAIKDDLAAWALSNEKMISSQTVTSSGNYLQDQKDILASAKAAYPPGSPQLKQLQQKYGF